MSTVLLFTMALSGLHYDKSRSNNQAPPGHEWLTTSGADYCPSHQRPIQVETAVGRVTIAIQKFEPGTRRLPRCDGGGRGVLVSDAQTGRDLALADFRGVIRLN
jgi:hypothetical protein